MEEREALLARIAELERENEELKAKKERNQRRAICPMIIGEKYGGRVTRAGYVSCSNSLAFLYNTELNELSRLIRVACFPTVRRYQGKKSGGKILTNSVMRTDDMTDEQYGKYCEVLDAILDTLSKHAIRKELRDVEESGK